MRWAWPPLRGLLGCWSCRMGWDALTVFWSVISNSYNTMGSIEAKRTNTSEVHYRLRDIETHESRGRVANRIEFGSQQATSTPPCS